MLIEEAFRHLREHWFNAKLKSYPHERDEDRYCGDRDADNAAMKAKYNEQTEAIISGSNVHKLAPRCGADLDST